jgi:hypothetical protein
MNTNTELIIASCILTLFILLSNSAINIILAYPIVANPNTNTNTNTKNTSRGQVILIPVNTGSLKLDQDMHSFYSCIKKAIKESKPTDLSEYNYFATEPTKAEVNNCYRNVFG